MLIDKHTPKHIRDNNYKLAGVHRIKVYALRRSHSSMLLTSMEKKSFGYKGEVKK